MKKRSPKTWERYLNNEEKLDGMYHKDRNEQKSFFTVRPHHCAKWLEGQKKKN